MTLDEFCTFFSEYQRRFIAFACSYVHDEATAEDITMESIMYYWENRNRLPADTNVAAYVLTTLKHRCIDYLRECQVRQEASDKITRLHQWELECRISSLEEFEPYEIFTNEIRQIIEHTLAMLPEQTRRIFEMSRLENKTYREIAIQTGMSVKGVEFHISNAIKALRASLKDYLPASAIFFIFL